MKYKRILLKLSGESLMGEKAFGIDNNRLAVYAEQIKEIRAAGVQVAIVIGGGNIFRGVQAEEGGMEFESSTGTSLRAHVDEVREKKLTELYRIQICMP